MEKAKQLASGYPAKLAKLFDEGLEKYQAIEDEEKKNREKQEKERIQGWQEFWNNVHALLPANVTEYIETFGLNGNEHNYIHQSKYVWIKIPGHAPIMFKVDGYGKYLIDDSSGKYFYVLTEYRSDFSDWDEKDIPEEGFYFLSSHTKDFGNLAPAIYFARRRWLEVYEKTRKTKFIHVEVKNNIEPVYEDIEKDAAAYPDFQDDVPQVQMIDVFSKPIFEDLVELVRGIVQEELNNQ